MQNKMTASEFAPLCKDWLRLSEDFNPYGNSVTLRLEVFNGKAYELIDSIHIQIPDGE